MSALQVKLSDTRGGVLILLALFLPVLITLAALVIDYGIAASGGEQHQNITNAAAIGSLESWLRQFGTGGVTATQARDRAQARAVELVNLNETLSQKATSSSGNAMDLNKIKVAGAGTGGENGTLTFGRWWFINPGGSYEAADDVCMGAANPCTDGHSPPECFQALDPTANCSAAPALSQSTFINAVRLDLNYAAGELSPSIFSKLWGFLGFRSNVTATAATIPIHAVFVGDLSDSMREETHLMRNPSWVPPYNDPFPLYQTPGLTVPFSLLLTGAAPGTDPGECNDPANDPCAGFVPAVTTCRCRCTDPCVGTCAWGLALQNDRTSYYGNPPQETEPAPRAFPEAQGLNDNRGAVTLPLTQHFKDDYQCVSVTYTENRGAGDAIYTEDYLIDVRNVTSPADGLGVASPDFYSTGQPFGTVLSAVYLGAQALNQRNAAGDLVAALFFDQHIMAPAGGVNKRLFPLTEPSLGNAAYRELIDAVNVDTNAFGARTNGVAYPNNLVNHVLFPRVVFPNPREVPRPPDPFFGVDTTALSERSYTDIPQALNAALTLLQGAANFSTSNNLVVLLTDSIQTCYTNPGGSPPFTVGDPDPFVFGATYPFCADFESPNTGESPWLASFWHDLDAVTIPNYVAAQVPIHLFSVGEHIGPSTINLLNPGGTGYLTEREARGSELSLAYLGFPDWNGFNSGNRFHYDLRSAEWPWFQPAYYFYHAARRTHGGYFPIRRIDPAAGSGNPAINSGLDPYGTPLTISNIPNSDALPGSSYKGGQAGVDIDPSQDWARIGPNGYIVDVTSSFLFNVPPNPPYRGIIQRYDPQGLNTYQQIVAALRQIIGNPSISLVSSP